MNGLMTISEVAAYFRMRAADVLRLIREDGLPVIELPGKARPVRKVSPMALHGWVVRHSKGEVLGLEDFLAELGRCRDEEPRTDTKGHESRADAGSET
jgi:hypothetical protein